MSDCCLAVGVLQWPLAGEAKKYETVFTISHGTCSALGEPPQNASSTGRFGRGAAAGWAAVPAWAGMTDSAVAVHAASVSAADLMRPRGFIGGNHLFLADRAGPECAACMNWSRHVKTS
jgi:hypothetical protein